MTYFKESRTCREGAKIREFKTIDIVKRVGVLSPSRVHLKNYPIDNPISIFNPTLIIKNDVVKLYARIILGYFMYVSAIAEVEIPLQDILTGAINVTHYPAELILYPSIKYDIWGVEDPRAQIIDGKYIITYVGRTINYFNPAIRRERTLPIVAISSTGKLWFKSYIFTLPLNLRLNVISDKDAVLLKVDNRLFILHRPHMSNEEHYLVYSEVPEDIARSFNERETPTEIEVMNTTILLYPAKFEIKLGWATPPIQIKNNEFIIFIHGVDSQIEGYRVLAAKIEYFKDEGLVITEVTPYYVMEPKLTYETFGDRPYVVFPCGVWRLDKNNLLIVYGAADYVTGFGVISLDDLLSVLSKGRIV